MRFLVLIFSLFIIFNLQLKAKSGVFVIDSISNIILKGANVHFKIIARDSKETTKLVVADDSGFAENPFDSRSLVFATFLGYNKIVDTLEINDIDTLFLTPYAIKFDEIVTTGQFIPQSAQKSVYNIKVINEEKIKLQSATNLRELLMNESNIRISQDNILGSSMSINGISGQNIKILVDGIPLIGRVNGNIDLSQVNMNNVASIEIIEGPMSTVYGTDALGGVINIITKDPLCDRYELDLNGYYESVGTYNFDTQARYNFGDYNIMASFGRNLFQGFSEVDTSRLKQWKPKEQYFGDWQYGRNWDKIRIRYVGKYFREFLLNRGAARPPFYETAFDDKIYTNRFTNSIYFNGLLDQNRYFDATLSYSMYWRHKIKYYKDLVNLSEIQVEDPTASDTSKFNTILLRATYSSDKLTENTAYQVGLELNNDNTSGKRIENQTSSILDFALFSSFQYKPLEYLNIQPALRFMYNSRERPVLFGIKELPLLPSLNIKYDLNDNLFLRASYANGFRAPSLRELYFLFVDINHNIKGNENLKPEISNSYNVSLSFNFNNLDYVVKSEVKAFYNDIDNLITLANLESSLYTYTNIGNYKTMGADYSIQYLDKYINSRISLAYTGRRNQIFEDDTKNKFKFAPELVSNVTYHNLDLDTKFSLFYKYTGELPNIYIDSEDQAIEYFIEDYSILDFSMEKTFFENSLSINIGIKNIFDVTNILSTTSVGGGAHSTSSNSNSVAWGRSFFANISYKLR